MTLDAGSYDVTETGPSGYTASLLGRLSGTIAIGETKTCTVTNDDQAAKLTVIKHVINDNGGTATPATSRSTRVARTTRRMTSRVRSRPAPT